MQARRIGRGAEFRLFQDEQEIGHVDGTAVSFFGFKSRDDAALAGSQTYYAPPPSLGSLRPVSAKPTSDEVRAAIQIFDEHIGTNFPFDEDGGASRAHALALCLQGFVTDVIGQMTPLFDIEAAQRRLPPVVRRGGPSRFATKAGRSRRFGPNPRPDFSGDFNPASREIKQERRST
jgi:hypothetical protein